jgi:phosphate:Na+ symporter
LGQADDAVDALYAEIVTYLGQLSQADLLPAQSKLLASYMMVANHLENIGDMVETNLVDVGATRLKQQVQVSQATQQILQQLHQKVNWSVQAAVASMVSGDVAQAQAVIRAKKEVAGLTAEANRYLGRRLVADEPNRLATFRLEAELVEYLKRVYYFAKRIAKETAGDIAEVQQGQG